MEDSHEHRGGRRETRAERMDRLFGDLLQELRVMQTGAQLTSGFLLTLPFQARFSTLDGFQRGLYLALVLLALLTTALVMTAVAVHQRLTGLHVKHRVVAAGRRILAAVLATLALLMDGIAILVVDVVWHRALALVVGVLLGLVLVGLLVLLPRSLLGRSTVLAVRAAERDAQDEADEAADDAAEEAEAAHAAPDRASRER